MNHGLNNAAQCYIGLIEGRPVAFMAILHFPHSRVKNFKAISRIVVLPDYQGIGIGLYMVNFVAEVYRQQGSRVIITTSNPAMRALFAKNKAWMLKRCGRVRGIGSSGRTGYAKTISSRRMTTSWEYRGQVESE